MLARFRVLAGLTQAELARAAGISLRALGDMERGRTRGPQQRTVQALAVALRLDPDRTAALDRAARDGRPRRTPTRARAPRPAPGTAAPAAPETPAAVDAPATETETVPATVPANATAADAGSDSPAEAVFSALALPRDIADFTAREDALARLHRLVRDADPAHPRIVLAYGQPGLGKTAFALHAAHTLAPQFPDGQLSLDLRGMAPTPLAPRDALGQILRALGVADRSVPADTEERASLFRTLVRERRLVLILDNAADEAQVRLLLPGSGPALTIITSRHVLPGLESVHRLPLDVLAPGESAALLARIAGPERLAAEPDAAAELARLCGHLPLALRIAGQRLVARPQQPVSHLVRQLAAEEYRLDVLEAGDLRVRAAFALSYRKLPAATALVLRRCSLSAGKDFTAATVAAYAGLPVQQTDRRLEELADAGLLQPAATPERYRLHDLVRLYAGERLAADDGPQALEAAREQAGDRLLRRAAAAGLRFDVEGAEHAGAESADPDPATAPVTLADARRWLEEEHPEWLAALQHANATGRHRQVVDTAEAMHWFSDSLLHWDVWAEVFRLSADSARAVGDRLAEAVHLNYLAWSHITCLHRYRSGLAVASQALDLARRIGDAQQEAWALAYCATALRRLHRPEEAMDSYRQAAEVFTSLEGRSAEVGRIVALRCVGSCLRESGRPREALESHRLLVAEILGWLDGSSPHIVHLLAGFAAHEVGLDHSALLEWSEAEAAYRQALGHFEGAGQPDSMTQTLTELGTALIELDRADEARELLTTALTDLTAEGARGNHRRTG
ncbi:helix-turn-helix domain-containing protein [Kitasatospora sp. NPDC005751]|uniref:ATP-binding protein n=1 Tax=Kitasatospora sp. NPDC005751 TaxID=3157064 RepID=UPI0033D8E873